MARSKPKKLKPAPVIAAPAVEPAPLAAELLTAPRGFGAKLAQADTPAWHYWPVLAVTALLAGLAYALLMRPGLNLAAQEAIKAAGQAGSATPTFLSHVTNAFGTVFLTAFTFLVMWGLGRLGTGPGPNTRGPRVAEVYSATFALLAPLYLLTIVLTLFTPAQAWALSPGEVSAAGGNLLELQRAAMHSAAQTPAALALIITSLLGTLAQFGLAYVALRETVRKDGRAALGVLLPLLPVLLIQFIGVAPLVMSRH